MILNGLSSIFHYNAGLPFCILDFLKAYFSCGTQGKLCLSGFVCLHQVNRENSLFCKDIIRFGTIGSEDNSGPWGPQEVSSPIPCQEQCQTRLLRDISCGGWKPSKKGDGTTSLDLAPLREKDFPWKPYWTSLVSHTPVRYLCDGPVPIPLISSLEVLGSQSLQQSHSFAAARGAPVPAGCFPSVCVCVHALGWEPFASNTLLEVSCSCHPAPYAFQANRSVIFHALHDLHVLLMCQFLL